jgi:uncharacterized protein (DUF302 family)
MTTTNANRKYGRMVEVDLSFDRAIEMTTAALKEQGFGVLTTIEVDKVLKDKIGVDRDRYVILGACNPQLADRGLDADIDIGLLLPCNVVVREEGDRRYVTFVDPNAMLAAAGESAELAALATDAAARLDAAASALERR